MDSDNRIKLIPLSNDGDYSTHYLNNKDLAFFNTSRDAIIPLTLYAKTHKGIISRPYTKFKSFENMHYRKMHLLINDSDIIYDPGQAITFIRENIKNNTEGQTQMFVFHVNSSLSCINRRFFQPIFELEKDTNIVFRFAKNKSFTTRAIPSHDDIKKNIQRHYLFYWIPGHLTLEGFGIWSYCEITSDMIKSKRIPLMRPDYIKEQSIKKVEYT